CNGLENSSNIRIEPRCRIGSSVARVKSVEEKRSPSLWIMSLERGLNSCKNGRRVSLNQPFIKRIRLSPVWGTAPPTENDPFGASPVTLVQFSGSPSKESKPINRLLVCVLIVLHLNRESP